MRHLASSLMLAAFLSVGILSAMAETGKFPGVKNLMTEEEYRQSGLDKLSDEERAALNAWLIRYTAFEAEVIKESVEEVKEETFKPVTTRIVGEFNGWSGKTVFRLENGQVWRQRLSGNYRYQATNPEVEVYRNWMGYYWLKIVETGKAVPVNRAKDLE